MPPPDGNPPDAPETLGPQDSPPSVAGQEEPEPEAPELRGRDILASLQARPRSGDGLAGRVLARGFGRAPIVSCSPRLFQRYELADPWNPTAEDLPLPLGPAARKLTERRRPAPHAGVREDKPKPPPAPPPPPQPLTQAPSRVATPETRGPPPLKPGATLVPRPARKPPPSPPERQMGVEKGLAKASAGRFRMKSTLVTPRALEIIPLPEVRELAEASEPPPAPVATTTPEPTPRAPRAPMELRKGPALMGLDDLFSAATQQGRDRRVGQEAAPPTPGSRKPKVVDRSESPAEKRRRQQEEKAREKEKAKKK